MVSLGIVERNGGQRRAKGLLASLATIVAVGASPAAAAGASLLGEWRFNEAAGDTALDRGPFGLDGRLGAAAGADASDPTRIAGVADGALRFDGDALVRLPDAQELAPAALSVEAVVRAARSPGQYRYILSRGSRRCFAGAYGLYTGAASGIAFYVFDGSRYVVTASARPEDVWDGNWHHVGAWFDGARLQLLVDGRPVGPPSAAVLRISYERTSASAAFGQYVGSCSLPFNGDLDLVRLWSGALPASAFAAAAQRELAPGDPASPAVGPALPVGAPPRTREVTPPKGRVRSTPGAPARACGLTLSRKRIVVRRRTAVRVHVTLRGRPVRAVRVVARKHGAKRAITVARTGRAGRARLVLRMSRPGKVRITAATKPRCAPAWLRAARRQH